MAKVGRIYYEDEPHKTWRTVYPSDQEYDEFVNGNEAQRLIHRYNWMDVGADPNRTTAIEWSDV